LVAALFALHPLHVESVAWVSERKDVLSGFFWIVTMWAYVRNVERPAVWRYCLMLGLFALGLMSKPMLVTLPCVLLLLDFWPLGRIQFTSRQSGSGATSFAGVPRGSVLWLVIEKLPLFFLSAASSVISSWTQHHGDSVVTLTSVSIAQRVANAAI